MVHQFLDATEKIEKWLMKYQITGYTINSDLTVDIDNHVFLSSNRLNYIPIQFGHVNGIFDFSDNKLTSFQGFPLSATSIIASDNNFKNTDNLKSVVQENILLYDCPLESITDLPTIMNGKIILDVTINENFKINHPNLYALRNKYDILELTSDVIETLKLNIQLNSQLSIKTNNSKKHKI